MGEGLHGYAEIISSERKTSQRYAGNGSCPVPIPNWWWCRAKVAARCDGSDTGKFGTYLRNRAWHPYLYCCALQSAWSNIPFKLHPCFFSKVRILWVCVGIFILQDLASQNFCKSFGSKSFGFWLYKSSPRFYEWFFYWNLIVLLFAGKMHKFINFVKVAFKSLT